MAINSLSSMSKGMSGLASGMDTQGMVDAMLAGTQAKIDKQKANKATLGYKQAMYRDVFANLKSLQDNFFTFGSKNNLLYPSFYNNMSASTKSAFFKATASSGATAGKVTVNSINQLAQTFKQKSADTAAGEVSGKLNLATANEQELTVTLDGVRKVIKLPPTVKDANGVVDAKKFAEDLQKTINRTLGNGMTVTTDGTNIKFGVTHDSHQFMLQGNMAAMDILGVSTGISNKVNTGMALGDINLKEPLQGSAFAFTINGTQFKYDDQKALSDIIREVNNSNAGVEIRYSTLEDKFSIESSVSGSGSTITMSQSEGNLLTSLFGTAGGGAATGDMTYRYDGLKGKIPGLEGDPAATLTPDDKVKVDALLATTNGELDRSIRAGSKFTLMVGGKEVTLTIPEKPADQKYTVDDLIAAVDSNAELKAAGVKLEMTVDSTNNRNGGVKLTANVGVEVSVAGNSSFGTLLGVSGSTKSQATADTTLAEMGITASAGKPLVITIGNQTLNITDSSLTAKQLSEQMTAALQKNPGVSATASISFDATESKGRFRIFGVDIPMDFTIVGDDNKLLGTSTLSVGQGQKAMETVSAGQNAVLYLGGQRVERSSNDFSIDGISYSLNETFNTGYNGTAASADTSFADVTVTRNTDQIFEGMTKFIDEYNKTLDKVWGMLKEDPTYKEYPPLTDKQKGEMTDNEIELWEKKSKEGLLRGDDTMEGIMSAMNRALTKRVGDSKTSLAEMGITTSYDFDKGYAGKLVFSDVTGQKLKDAIAQDPGAIERLFTDDKEGIATELNKILHSATSDTAGIRNDPYANLSLVNQAGRPGVRDTTSSIYKEIRNINENLETLGRKYESEYKRYWKQFNAMEQMISNMNQQSSWLTQQLGS
ncbi:MAG: flagellar filament capping protein FliD [Angelakisella sp.]